jgi:hypothetical protein
MIKKLLATLALAAVLTAGVTAPSAPAQAAWSDCSNYPGTICLFAGPNYGLPIWRQYPSQITGCRNLTGFDNVTTIAANQATHHLVVLWQYAGCGGESITLPAQGYVINFSGSWWNDKPSSIEVIAH